MSDAEIAPESVAQLTDAVAGRACVLAVGNQTKPPLSRCNDATLLSLRSISGITEYEPSEFTFTAHAGTTIAEIESTLGEKNQYLPMDPMLVDAGATLGGTIASGLSGPGRFRYGGLRDFLLGVSFLSGDGQVIHAGGKVVKNAAGFDLPKFLVGSLGRLGIMLQMTLKVFPRPVATQTLTIRCDSHQQAIERMSDAASSRWEADAIDYRPDLQTLLVRLAGPEKVTNALAEEIRSTWNTDVSTMDSADAFWHSLRELTVHGEGIVVKVPTTQRDVAKICDALTPGDGVHLHVSAAGNLSWLWLDRREAIEPVNTCLQSLNLSGLIIRGEVDRPQIGQRSSFAIEQAIKAAMDPPQQFPSF